MGEEHFDLLSEPHRDSILFGLGYIAGDLARVFVFFAGDGAEIGVRGALGFGWAGLTDQFQPAIFCPARTFWAAARIGIVAAELLEKLTFWADVVVTLWVPLEVFTAPRSIGAADFINHRNMRGDAMIY